MARAYGPDHRESDETRSAVAALKQEIVLVGPDIVPAGLHDRVKNYLRAALNHYVVHGHVNAATDHLETLNETERPVRLGNWVRHLRGGEGAGRGLVEPFLTALGMRLETIQRPADEGAARAGRELAERLGSLAGAVARAYGPDHRESDETRSAVAALKQDIAQASLSGQVKNYLRAALDHYVVNGHMDARYRDRIGRWLHKLRRGEGAGRGLVEPFLTALGMRLETNQPPANVPMGTAGLRDGHIVRIEEVAAGQVVVGDPVDGSVAGSGGPGRPTVPDTGNAGSFPGDQDNDPDGMGTPDFLGGVGVGSWIRGEGGRQDLPLEADSPLREENAPPPQSGDAQNGDTGRQSGVTKDQASNLKTLAEKVADAYERQGPQSEETRKAAVAELDQALASIQTSAWHVVLQRAALCVRAALGHLVAHGTVNAGSTPVPVDGKPVNLGWWLERLRNPEDHKLTRYWVEPVMVALGMRWRASYVPPGGLVLGVSSVERSVAVVLQGLAATVVKERPEAVRLGLDPNNLAGSGVFGETVGKLDAALAGIQSGLKSTDEDRSAALYLRAALGYYVTHGTGNAPRGKKMVPMGGGKLVDLSYWVERLRNPENYRSVRSWVEPVMRELGMRNYVPTGDVASAARLAAVRDARLVRDPEAPQNDLTHPEWDLTQPEWDLIKRPLEEAFPKVAPGNVRRHFNAVMYRARNLLSMKADVPSGFDRYHTKTAGINQFYEWARAEAFGKVWDIVRDNPAVHDVVQRAVRALFDAAEWYLNKQDLKALVEETDADRPSAAPLRPDSRQSTEPVWRDFFG
ncbi:hypothetical protein ACFZAR_44440 [Streptomyces sp. NPDC008222]|uniref:hypothetical protein n=1 Tax=Streptomyces sp. NPDC008222 TaxID=3364820 RepID=UPI0036F00C32